MAAGPRPRPRSSASGARRRAHGQFECPVAVLGGGHRGVGGQDGGERAAERDVGRGLGQADDAVRHCSPAQGYAGGPARESAESTISAGRNRPSGRWAAGQELADAVPHDIAPLIIETRGLTKRFGRRTAVADVDLSVPAGLRVRVPRPQRSRQDDRNPHAGRPHQARRAARSGSPACPLAGTGRQVLARVGAVIEEPRFHNHLTGRENLRVIAAARGPRSRRQDRAGT